MKYAFFIASFINDQRSENILIECIKSIKDNCTISNDIYIINDNWDKKENILKLIDTNNFKNVYVKNTPIKGCAFIYIIEYVQLLDKTYDYYINLHDTMTLLQPLPVLVKDCYYSWRFPKCWLINKKYLDLCLDLSKKIELNINEKKFRDEFNTSNFWLMFGCSFIIKKEFLDIIYKTKFKNIFKFELNRWDRIALEYLLGYVFKNNFLEENKWDAIEDKSWSEIKPTKKKIGDIIYNHVWDYKYFAKISLGR